MSINTLAAVRTLEKTGMPEKQAEAVVELMRQNESGEWRVKIETTLKLHTGLLLTILGVGIASIWVG